MLAFHDSSGNLDSWSLHHVDGRIWIPYDLAFLRISHQNFTLRMLVTSYHFTTG